MRLRPDFNAQVERAVIIRVAQHPQSSHGAHVLIAETALREMDPSSPEEMGIRELAAVRPNPHRAATAINNIHDRFSRRHGFKIPNVSPEAARDAVYAHAFGGVDVILAVARRLSREMNIEPAGLPQCTYPLESIYPLWPQRAGMKWLSRAVAQRRANGLHAYLAKPGHDELRKRVIADIAQDAGKRREDRPDVQRWAATKLGLRLRRQTEV